jgi:phosphoenolpyruvate phosphomutase
LLTDEAIADYKRLPYLSFEHRKKVLENIQGVHQVVEQNEWDYSTNIRKYRPDFMVHGDDWIEGPLAPFRKKAIHALSEYGGKLIEVPYTRDISSSDVVESLLAIGTTPEIRKKTLKRLLSAKKIARFIEAHSPISALIAEKSKVDVGGKVRQFDGFWSSSLADSAVLGLPDNELVSFNTRLESLRQILNVSSLPLLFDGDTGGQIEHFTYNISQLVKVGVGGVIIEDKKGLKRNSLLNEGSLHELEDPKKFAEKITNGKIAAADKNFSLIARLESLISGRDVNEAIERAALYVAAGADGIMIHSKQSSPNQILVFAERFRHLHPKTPLVAVPTTYNSIYESDLEEAGFNLVIYANQMLRSSIWSMKNTAREILKNTRSYESELTILPISELLKVTKN